MDYAEILSPQMWANAGGRLNVNTMRPHLGIHVNGLLMRQEWEDIDNRIIDVTRTQLVVANDLIQRNLVRRLGGLGSTVAVYQQLSDMDEATVHMSVATNVDEDRLVFSSVFVPVPIISKDFRVDARTLDAGRRMGDGIDTTTAMVAGRKVADKLEDMILNGYTGIAVSYEGSARTIYGLTTQPSRLTDTAANYGGGDFATEGNGYGTINGQISALKAAGFYGPYGCYIARTQHSQLMLRHTDGSGKSNLAVIAENFPELEFIKASDDLAAGSCIVFQLSPDVIELAIAQDVTTIQWSNNGGLVEHYKVMTAAVPLVKATAEGVAGISHATSA